MKNLKLETITILFSTIAFTLYVFAFVLLYLQKPQQLVSELKDTSLYQKVSYTPVINETLQQNNDIDLIPPDIFMPVSAFETSDSTVSFDVTSREPLQQGEFLHYSINQKENASLVNGYEYTVTISDLTTGENKRAISFYDQYENVTTENISITRTPVLTFTNTDNETVSKIWADGNDLLAVVDKEYALYSTYAPSDLVYLSDYNIFAANTGMLLRSIAVNQLKVMFDDAASNGYDLKVLSAYRSYAMQVSTYNYWVSAVGQLQADRASARPGHSEHQLGTTVDLTSSDVSYKLSGNFGYTPSGKWLTEHAHEYGFVLSYPEGSESVTGYKYEPWHYRYVGVEYATKIYENGSIPITYLRSLAFDE